MRLKGSDKVFKVLWMAYERIVTDPLELYTSVRRLGKLSWRLLGGVGQLYS